MPMHIGISPDIQAKQVNALHGSYACQLPVLRDADMHRHDGRINILTLIEYYRMTDITIEKADYIIAYYNNLLTSQEAKALRHHRSLIKLDGTVMRD
jgi:hypothetical protein